MYLCVSVCVRVCVCLFVCVCVCMCVSVLLGTALLMCPEKQWTAVSTEHGSNPSVLQSPA